MKKNNIFLILIIFIVLINVFNCCSKKEEKKKKVRSEPLSLIEVEEIKMKNTYEKISLVGQIQGIDEIQIYPDTGIQGIVRNLRVDEGSRVRQGTPLMEIDQRAVTGYRYRNFVVRATISGIISDVKVRNGDKVSATSSLCTIVKMDKVKVAIDIPEKEISRINRGQNVNIFLQSYPDKKLSGEIVQIFPAVDPNTLTLRSEVVVTNPDHTIKPGMFAQVDILTETKQAILIPLTSMIIEDNIRYVYIYDPTKQRVFYREILTGDTHDEDIEVTRGLKVGERIVVEGNYEVTDNEQVRVRNK